MDLNDLKALNIKKLAEHARDLDIQGVSTLNKQELIVKILQAQAEKDGSLYAQGVIEVLPDGYGFLRSADFSYLPGPDDIYVSPSQIKRFSLRTGHVVSGQIRPPKAKERFYALLKLDLINERQPEEVKNCILFDNYTPMFPQEKFSLEDEPKNMSMRIMDLVTPIGKGQRGLITAAPKTGKLFCCKSWPTPSAKIIRTLKC